MSELASARRLPPHAPLPPTAWVCGHCKRPVTTHYFACEGHWLASWHCSEHGDTVPIRNAAGLRGSEWPDWSAA